MGLIIFDKVPGNIASHTIDVGHLVAKPNTIEFVCMFEQFGTKSGGNELGLGAQLVDHVGNGLSMLGVKSLEKKYNYIYCKYQRIEYISYLIDFIKQIKRSRIAFLNGKD